MSMTAPSDPHDYPSFDDGLAEVQQRFGVGGREARPGKPGAGPTAVPLGDIIEDYAFTVKVPEEFRIQGLTREEQRVFVAVERYRHKFGGEPLDAVTACNELDEKWEVYEKARRIAIATTGEAFSCKEDSLIKPTDAIVTGIRTKIRKGRQ